MKLWGSDACLRREVTRVLMIVERGREGWGVEREYRSKIWERWRIGDGE